MTGSRVSGPSRPAGRGRPGGGLRRL